MGCARRAPQRRNGWRPAGARAPPPPPRAAPPTGDESQPPPAARRRAKERVIQESLLPEAPQQYELPPITLLGELSKNARGLRSDPTETARALEQTLTSFGGGAKVVR